MKTLKLSEIKGMLKRIATAKIKKDGVYKCLVDGEKVRVVN